MGKWTVAYGDFIGRRLVGWCLFNGQNYSFLSEKQVKAKLELGISVNGLKLNEEGKVVVDTDFARNLMAKSGLSFRFILEEQEKDLAPMNRYYALVEVQKTEKGSSYHFITNHCGYEILTEDKVKSLFDIVEFGGIKCSESGELLVHAGVNMTDRKKGQEKAKAGRT